MIDISKNPVYAAYLNMAQHNCFMILKYIAQMPNISPKSDPDLYNKAKETDEKTGKEKYPNLNLGNIKDAAMLNVGCMPDSFEAKEKLLELLVKHFTLLQPAFESCKVKKSIMSLADATSFLVKVFTILTYYRDMASHTIFNDTRDIKREEKSVGLALNFMLTASCRGVKERFSLDNELSFFQKNRYFRQGREMKLKTNFSHCVFENDNLNSLSDIGLIYMTCLLLERKYAKMFVDKLESNFYSICKDDKQRQYLFEIFTFYHIRLPYPKLNSSKDEMSIAMDMLNELKKCPKELFDVLSPEKQEEFALKSTTGERVLLRRNSDRFPELALRWIDQKKSLETLRFQITFGKYHYVFCDEKNCADGISRTRTIVKDLNGFGRIDDIEKRRKGCDWNGTSTWNGAELVRQFEDVESDHPGMAPYVTDSSARYIIENNMVGLSDFDYMPEIGEDNEVRLRMPAFWLSKYDIPGLVFHSMLADKVNDSKYNTENVILDYRKRYQKLFSDLGNAAIPHISCKDNQSPKEYEYRAFCKKYKLEWNEIPDKIKQIALGKEQKEFLKSAKEAINRELVSTSKRLKAFDNDKQRSESKDNKMGKDGFVMIKPGRLADFLAKDIVKYQPFVDSKDKPTGLNYSIMQAAIATFSEQQQLGDLKIIFKNLKIAGGEKSANHPFLSNVLDENPKNTLDIYELYLKSKKSYLENRLELENDDPESFKIFIESLPFFNPNKIKWSDMNTDDQRKLAEHYLAMPILLPRGLFEKEIREMLKLLYPIQMGNLLDKKDATGKEQCNTPYMINIYNQKVCDDNVQGFYSYEINDELFELLNKPYSERDLRGDISTIIKEVAAVLWKKKNDNQKKMWETTHDGQDYASCFATKVHRAIRVRKALEQDIRRAKVQDILLFIMAKDSLLGKIEADGFKLKEVGPKSEKSILSAKISELRLVFSLPMLIDKTDKEKKKNISGLFHQVIVVCRNVAIKDYGKMMSLMCDNRIQSRGYSLLAQLAPSPNTPILYFNYEDIENELENYDMHRVNLLKNVLDFESKLVDLIKKQPDNSLQTDISNNERIDFSKILKCYDDNESDSSRTVSQIRNSMCHN